MHRVLIVDDEEPIRNVLSASLQDEGYIVETANNGEKALRMMEEFKPEVTLLDIWMPGRLDGVEVLREAKKTNPDLDFIIMSGHGTIETAVKTTKYGAWDFVEKPLSIEKILISIKNIIEFQHERAEKKALLNKLRKNIALIGNSDGIKTHKQNLARVAQTSNWILIEGEPGVGKELSAQNVHYLGATASQPFLYVNTRTAAGDVLEAELFGYEKGFFPGAKSLQKGKLEIAGSGTVFINEIGSLGMETQAKLLQVMQSRSFSRLGGQELIPTSVRLIGASTTPLIGLVKSGLFNKNLYERLNLVPISIAPLRDRKEDVPLLAHHFSNFFARENGTQIKAFAERALKEMSNYNWPGNIRELKNFVERLYILNSGTTVDVESLEIAGFLNQEDETENALNAPSLKLARSLFERQFILKKLQENNGNVTKTADQIGVERSHLHRKIKGYGIETKDTMQ